MKMKIKLLFLFILFPAFVFSQTKIRGKVFDKETQKPVSDVIIHSGSRISVTNDKGEYDFEINQSETVYFRHLSYNSFKIQSDSLHNGDIAYLTPSVNELDEVVISPNRNKYLLNKAIDNLFANFQKEKTNTYYLTHVEENTTKGGEREVYALIETVLDKVRNDKKQFFNWDLKLTQLDRIKNTGKDDFIVNGKKITTKFFSEKLSFSSNKTKKDTVRFLSEIYDENSDYWIIKVYPQYLNNRYYHYLLYTINKKDTILTEILTQSYSNSSELTTVKKSNYSVSNDFDIIKFSKNASGLYYLEQFQYLIDFKIINDTPCAMTLKGLTYTVENISPDEFKQENKKRLWIPYTYYLYYNKLPDSPGFWKKYLKP
jgi:hypothetical protein